MRFLRAYGFDSVAAQAEEANLPETMCRLTEGMRSIEQLRALMRTAKDLMLNTPKSFRKILRSALYANLSQVRTRPRCEGSEVVAADSRFCSGSWRGGKQSGSLGEPKLRGAFDMRRLPRTRTTITFSLPTPVSPPLRRAR